LSDDIRLLQTWLKRTRESQIGHYAAAEKNSVRHLYIGIPAAIFSAVVGTAVFSALGSSQELDIRLRFLVAAISIVTAILTGCQTFLRFSEKSDAHRAAAAKFAELRRFIEQSLSFPASITSTRADEVRPPTRPRRCRARFGRRRSPRRGTTISFRDRSLRKPGFSKTGSGTHIASRPS
jgi:hypothetical protein